MADRPSVTLKINATGGAGAVDQLDDVAAAQDRVADATADAAKAAAAQGDAGAKAESKLKKLWEGLKAGAGAAAGAAAGLTGMAVTLKGQLSPETQTAVAGLQGLSGVLAAFGPVGALASVAVSGVAAALAAFDDTLEVTKTTGEGFLEKALKPMIDAMVTIADKADAATSSVKRMQVAAQSEFEVFTPAEIIRADKLRVLIAQNALAVQTLGREVEQYERRVDSLSADGSSVWSPQTEEIQKQAKALKDAGDRVSFYRFELEDLQRTAREREAGPSAPPRAVSTAPRAPDDSIERSVAFFVKQAEMAQANLVGAFTAATAMAEHEAARVAEASAAAAAQYSDQIAQVIAAGADAQQDAIRRTEQDAARLIGIYDDLTTGVSDFGKAAGEGFAAAAVSAAIYGGSLKDAANQALQAATVTAATEALIATAKGLGYLAAGAFGYAPGIAAAQASFAAAGVWAGIAGGAALGAAATGGFGGGGGGGGVGSLGPDTGGPPTALDRPAAAEAPQDREFFINLNSGAGGSKPLSRGDAGAIATALVDIFRAGGMRLEARRA